MLGTAAAFCTLSRVCMVDQDLAHRPRRDSEEVHPVLPVDVRLIDQFDIRLVDQCRRLQRMVLPLVTEVDRRSTVQFGIYQRQQLIERTDIAIAPLVQQLGDI